MQNVYIIGLGMIRFARYPDRTVREMAHEVIRQALEDAGLRKEDLGAAYFSNTFWGMYTNQHSIRGQCVMRSMGVGSIPVVNVENACAKNHWHGSLNPLAQYQQDMTVEEVLADKPVAYPLTRAMCLHILERVT